MSINPDYKNPNNDIQWNDTKYCNNNNFLKEKIDDIDHGQSCSNKNSTIDNNNTNNVSRSSRLNYNLRKRPSQCNVNNNRIDNNNNNRNNNKTKKKPQQQ